MKQTQPPSGNSPLEPDRPNTAAARPAETISSSAESERTTMPPEAATRSPSQPASRSWTLPEQLPATFGRYELIRLLGQGGMGTVYLAHDTQLDRQVALKIPQFRSEDGSSAMKRFFREARAAATLHHANICPVYDVGEVSGTHYLTMAYIEGRSLADVIRKSAKPLSLRQAAALVRKLALALEEAHRKQVIHRDLKPANVMLNQRGEPVIMDFGLAHRSNPKDTRLTQHGAIMGTPAYMAPEQAKGNPDELGPSCDIYSLGVILYELLTGRPPFEGDTMAVLAQLLIDEPKPPSAYRPDLDRKLEAICLKAMTKTPESRYRSMGELATVLADYLKATSPPTPAAGAQASPTPELPLAEMLRELEPRPAAKPAAAGGRVGQSGGRGAVPRGQQDFQLGGEAWALPRSRHQAAGRGRKLASWTWLAAAGAAALFVLSGVIYIATNKGTIKIELNVADAIVRVDGDLITIEQLGEPITLRAGEHKLVVKRGDMELETRRFTVKRGDNPALRVEIEPKVAGKPAEAVPAKPQGKTTEQPPATPDMPAAIGSGQPLDREPKPPTIGEVRRFDGHTDTVWSVAFSADGRQFWSGSSDGTVRIWDRDTGEDTGATVRQIDLRGGRIVRVACSDHFRAALTSHPRDNLVRVWNTESGQEVRQLQGHTSPVWSISLSPDGRRALAGAEDGAVRLWDVNSGNEIGRFDGHSGLVQSVVFSPDGRRALSGSQDKLVCLWDLQTGKRLQTFEGHTGKVCSLAFSSDGRRAVSGGGGVDARGQPADSSVHLWDLESGQELQCLRGHTNGVTGVAFTPDARHVVSASYDKTLRFWEVQTGKELHRFDGHAEVLECVALSPDGRFAVSGGHDKAVRLWRLPVPEASVAKAAPAAEESQSIGRWISIMPTSEEVSRSSFANYENGLLHIQGEWAAFSSGTLQARNAIIRVVVKKLEGQSIDLNLRDDSLTYKAQYSGDGRFAIRKSVSENGKIGWVNLANGRSPKPLDDFFEFAFKAADDLLSVEADGTEVVRVRDASYDRVGFLTFGVFRGQGQFKKAEIQLLDDAAAPAAANIAPGVRPPADLAQEMQKLNGRWRFVKGELNGKEITGQFADQRQMLLSDGTYVQKFGGNTIEGTYQIDPTKRPKTIDFTPLKGGGSEAQGKPRLGIYELDGGILRYCVVAAGDPRPTEFSTNKPHGGQSLQTYVRERKDPVSAPPRLVRLDELNTPGRDWFPWLSPDGLTIYWDVREPGKPNAIWTAWRKDANSPFANKTRLLEGRHPSVTGDGLQMLLVRRRPDSQRESLHVATRPSIDRPFGEPREILELRSANERESPCLEPDGLTLYLKILDHGKAELAVTSRTPGGAWESPQSLPLADPLDHKLTWPFLTADRLRLFCTHEGDVGLGRIMLWSRPTATAAFTEHRYLDLPDGAPPFRRAPRYVEATDELFFSATGPRGQGEEDLWVVKGFQP